MKRLYSLLNIIAVLLLFASCESKEDIFYDNLARIYFPSDSINYSFGDKPFSVQKFTLDFPVKIMGVQSKEIRKFKVEVDEENTTAIAGTHYTALPSEFDVLADSVNAYIPIELLRAGISGEEPLRISLKIIEGGDFTTGVKESLAAKLTFNNYLEKPEWWGAYEFSFGVYQQEKYQKYIEIHGSAIDKSYAYSNFLAVMKEFKKVKEYFDAHPEYGIVFPADAWWP